MAIDWAYWLRLLLGGTSPAPPAAAPPAPKDRYVKQPILAKLTDVPVGTLCLDGGTPVPGLWSLAKDPDNDGWFMFTLPASTPTPFGATVFVSAKGNLDASQRFELAAFDATRTTQDVPILTLAIVPPVPVPPVPPAPVPLPPAPPPVPVPAPPTQDAIVLSLAQVASGDCPDVRPWPIVGKIHSFTLADHEQFERGDTMIEFEGRDALPLAMGSQGGIAYTLWIGLFIQGVWRIVPIVECVRDYVPTGQLLAPGQLPENLTYFAAAPVKGYQPKAGEDVIFFATTGDTRRQNAQADGTTPGRTNVIRVPFRAGAVTF